MFDIWVSLASLLLPKFKDDLLTEGPRILGRLTDEGFFLAEFFHDGVSLFFESHLLLVLLFNKESFGVQKELLVALLIFTLATD